MLDDIERIIKEENVREQIRDGRPEEDGILFYGVSNGRNVSIVTRLDKYGNVDADLAEVTANTPRKMKLPPFTPLTEAVRRVAIHQGSGASPVTPDSIAHSASGRNGVSLPTRYSKNPSLRLHFVTPHPGILKYCGAFCVCEAVSGNAMPPPAQLRKSRMARLVGSERRVRFAVRGSCGT